MNDDYKTGFNAGFMLTEHLPELAQTISKTDSAIPWLEGFRDGHKEYYDQEQAKETYNQKPVTLRLTWLEEERQDRSDPPKDPEQEWDRDAER